MVHHCDCGDRDLLHVGGNGAGRSSLSWQGASHLVTPHDWSEFTTISFLYFISCNLRSLDILESGSTCFNVSVCL